MVCLPLTLSLLSPAPFLSLLLFLRILSPSLSLSLLSLPLPLSLSLSLSPLSSFSLSLPPPLPLSLPLSLSLPPPLPLSPESTSDTTYFTAGFFEGSSGLGRHFSISYQTVTTTVETQETSLSTSERLRTIKDNNNWLRCMGTMSTVEPL